MLHNTATSLPRKEERLERRVHRIGYKKYNGILNIIII
jgi:hypothetical protein